MEKAGGVEEGIEATWGSLKLIGSEFMRDDHIFRQPQDPPFS